MSKNITADQGVTIGLDLGDNTRSVAALTTRERSRRSFVCGPRIPPCRSVSATSPWVVQQLREAFPEESAPRFLIYDNDSIFSERVTEPIKNIGIEPHRTAFRSPWQNGIAERWVGSARREMLDHVIVMNERHLHRLLREYVDYYNTDRVHTRLRDSPMGRPKENWPSSDAKIVGSPRVGRLHHRYAWREAA